MSAPSVHLNELGIVCALGVGKNSVADAMWAVDAPRGVVISERYTPGRPLALGEVQASLPDMGDLPLPMRSRNSALLRLAYAQIRGAVDAAIAEYGAPRVAVIVGTSTSGIAEAEQAIADGKLDAVAFGTGFLANPDLPARIKAGAELNQPNPATFYSPGPAGYTDYPSLAAAQ